LSVSTEFLEYLCKPKARAHEDLMSFVRSPGFSWGETLEQALRQKILPLLAFEITDRGNLAEIPKYILQHLEESLEVNRRRVAYLRETAREITNAFDLAGIPFFATKGIVLESQLYGRGARFMNDADFMIEPENREVTREILKNLGFGEGLYHRPSDSIEPFERKDQILYQLNPDHLPIVARLIDDPVIRCVHVDFANSLTWHGSPFEVAMSEVFREKSMI